MLQRIRAMNSNDGVNIVIATAGGAVAWDMAEFMAVFVPILWAIYVILLIGKTIPEFSEKHPWFKRFTCGTADMFRRAFRWIKR